MGYTKYLCPYGVLIVGKADYKDENLLLTANYIANILDPKATGTVGTSGVYYDLRKKMQQEAGFFLAGATTEADKIFCDAVGPVAKVLKASGT